MNLLDFADQEYINLITYKRDDTSVKTPVWVAEYENYLVITSSKSAGKVKRINETNTKIIKEKRLALSMAVLSQVHLANIDYSMALEEYDTAERYYEVSKKITEQVKNAQKIARFGNLELIREQASLLVAELRYDIAYSKLQHSIGKIYTSVGIDITRENINNINFKDYASIIKNNFKTKGKTYYAKIKKPIREIRLIFLSLN